MAVRLGERSFEETLAEIDEVAGRLGEALARTSLPDEPDRAAVDAFLVSAYRRAWGWSWLRLELAQVGASSGWS